MAWSTGASAHDAMPDRRRPKLHLIGMLVPCFASVPGAAVAHGIPPPLAHAIIGVFVVVAVAPVFVDFVVFKRWAFTERPGYAAILGHIAAILVAVPMFQALQSLGSTLAYALEPSSMTLARWLRFYSWTIELVIAALVMALTKALVLKWCFAWRLTPLAFGALFLSIISTVAGSVAIAVLYLFATR